MGTRAWVLWEDCASLLPQHQLGLCPGSCHPLSAQLGHLLPLHLGWRDGSACRLPEGKLSGIGCLCWDLEAGSPCLCPIRKGMVTEHLLSSPLGRKQRNSTDPEYTEKLQQYGECESPTNRLCLPSPNSSPMRKRRGSPR